MKMPTSYFGILLRYLLVFVLTALAFNYFIHEGFDRGDFLPFVFWGLPSILINSAVISRILRSTKKTHFIIRFFVQFIVAVVLSYFGAISYSLFLGAWAGALGFASPLLVHLAGAFAGSFWIERWGGSRIRKFILNVSVYVFIIIFFGVGFYRIILFTQEEIMKVREIRIVTARGIEKKFSNEQEIRNYYCSETMESKDLFLQPSSFDDDDDKKAIKDFCSSYLRAFIELYNSKGVVFRTYSWSHRLMQYKGRVNVFLVFSNSYKLSLDGEFFKVPKSDFVVYFHDGDKWEFFPKKTEFLKQQIAIRLKKEYRNKFCLSIESSSGRSDDRGCTVFLDLPPNH